ncbi:hypothetical protein BgiBS90_026379 [Biomphalaria glabrata]|nr:hypothetical protein BgiBS90_026379 [Biomphalaria glabrata]
MSVMETFTRPSIYQAHVLTPTSGRTIKNEDLQEMMSGRFQARNHFVHLPSRPSLYYSYTTLPVQHFLFRQFRISDKKQKSHIIEMTRGQGELCHRRVSSWPSDKTSVTVTVTRGQSSLPPLRSKLIALAAGS